MLKLKKAKNPTFEVETLNVSEQKTSGKSCTECLLQWRLTIRRGSPTRLESPVKFIKNTPNLWNKG